MHRVRPRNAFAGGGPCLSINRSIDQPTNHGPSILLQRHPSRPLRSYLVPKAAPLNPFLPPSKVLVLSAIFLFRVHFYPGSLDCFLLPLPCPTHTLLHLLTHGLIPSQTPGKSPTPLFPFPSRLLASLATRRAAFLYSARRSLSVTDGPEPSAYLSLWEPVTPVGLRHWHFCVWQMGEAVGNLLGASAAPGVKTHPTRPLSLSLNTVLGGRDAWSW